MTSGKRCCDILALERAKRARKEEKKKSVQSFLCTVYSGVLRKKSAGVYPIARYSSNHCRRACNCLLLPLCAMSQINNYLRCVGRVARMHEALVVWLNLAKLFRFFPP